MSKKPATKKDKNPPPEPVPVEEPPQPSPEELALLAEQEKARQLKLANIQRVTFPKLPIKQIVSYHSSTILATNENHPMEISITDTKENEVRIAFRHKAGDRGFVTYQEVAEVFAELLHFSSENPNTFTHHVQQIRSFLPRFLPTDKKSPSSSQLHSTIPNLPTEEEHKQPLEATLLSTDNNHNNGDNHNDSQNNAPASHLDKLLFSEADFLALFLRFFAPSFYYGSHLRMFAGRNCVSNVKELLYRGCAINTANGEGLTALHIACEHNHPDIIDLLVAMHDPTHPMLHLQVNVQDKHGWTPLHCAVYHGSFACMMKLLALNHPSTGGSEKKHAEHERINAHNDLSVVVHLTTKEGDSVLHFACIQNRGSFIAPLLKAGVRFSHVNLQGRTPLHEAAMKGHLSLFQEYSTLLSHLDHNNNKTGIPLEDKEVVRIQDALKYEPSVYCEIDETPKVFV